MTTPLIIGFANIAGGFLLEAIWVLVSLSYRTRTPWIDFLAGIMAGINLGFGIVLVVLNW